jgi:phosphate transport system protein
MAASQTRYAQELVELRSGVLAMGSMVEQTIGEAMRALIEGNVELARGVIVGDHEVNELDRRLREHCFTVIAGSETISPADLRLIFSFQHIVLELERMADHATHIARAAIRLHGLPPLDAQRRLPEMARLTQIQVTEILKAVVDADETLARQIAPRDDAVDALYRELWSDLIRSMAEPENVERAAILLFVAKDVERIADRVTNIAEDVLFLQTGHVVELG